MGDGIKKVCVSVPGKVHLMGEHAVVYGKPALLTAINLRMRVTVLPNPAGRDAITIISTEPADHARYAAEFVLGKLRIQNPEHISITIESDIPAGFHLGSSAAVAVGITGAVMYYFRNLWNPMKINELAYEIEKKQHGNPSGGDNTAVTVGGLIWFRKELEFLKSIWQLPFKPHASVRHFFLINTGRPEEATGEMVALVKEQTEKYPERMQKLFDQNETQVKRVTVALKEGNEAGLIDAIRTGEKTLEDMGVVSEKIQTLLRKIEKSGGAVKILGGGGRKQGAGFLLCYHRRPEEVEKIIHPYQYSIRDINLGEEGVRLEEK